MNKTEIWRTAHETFEQYAAMDAPDLPDDPLSVLQVRLHRWQVENFGYQPSWMMVLGIAEEVGELMDANDHESVDDALGDAMIYATQLCTDLRLDFGVLLRSERVSECGGLERISKSIGRMAHATLKSSQRIRGFDDPDRLRSHMAECIVELLRGLKAFSPDGTSLTNAYLLTAEYVMMRNWKANPVTGGAG